MRGIAVVLAICVASVLGLGVTPGSAAAPVMAVETGSATSPKIASASGRFVGGTVVTIRGKRFVKVTKVLFGRDRGSSVVVKNPRKLTVVTPRHEVGTGTTGVSFGGTPATSFTVNSDSSITVTTPPHATGLVDVTVTAPAGSSTRPVLFLYLP